jgi:hypothetical protein
MRTQMLLAIAVLNICWIIVGGHAQETNLPFNGYFGGGIGVPVSSTRRFAGISGIFQIGAGPNLTKHNSLEGEFMWQGLPANLSSLTPVVNSPGVNPLISTQPTNNLSTATNLYALTTNYKFHMEGHRFGFYMIGGGGWYFRHAELKNYTVPPGTVCQPIWDWYGYTCANGLVSMSNTLISHGVSSGGMNGGGGITMYLGNVDDYPTEFYMEARYHYSPQGGRVPTKIVPVTFGIRW